jgi:hypothetical protein
MQQVVLEETQEDRVCRLAQSRNLFLTRAVDRYRLIDPHKNCAGVASGTLDEIEAQLKSGLKGESAKPECSSEQTFAASGSRA